MDRIRGLMCYLPNKCHCCAVHEDSGVMDNLGRNDGVVIPEPRARGCAARNAQIERQDQGVRLYRATHDHEADVEPWLTIQTGDRLSSCNDGEVIAGVYFVSNQRTNQDGLVSVDMVVDESVFEGQEAHAHRACDPHQFESRGSASPVQARYNASHGASIVVAVYDFQKRYENELSLKRSAELTVLYRNGAWIRVRHNDTKEVGFVPSNYVADPNSLEGMKYFFGDMSREEESRVFSFDDNKRPGKFLVRESTTRKGSYTLTVYTNPLPMSYMILNDDDQFACDGDTGNRFDSLMDLIDHYMSDNGKPRLSDPCKYSRKGPQLHDQEVNEHDEWDIGIERLKFESEIGSGNFGTVWLAILDNREKVAVKGIKSSNMSTQAFLDEANTMKKLKHVRIVKFVGISLSTETPWIVTEFMSNGCLRTYLSENARLPENTLVDMAGQVSAGMEYLESENCVHGDLRTANILVSENVELKIADFGHAKLVRGGTSSAVYYQENVNFPVKWTAPEVIKTGAFSSRSDVWSFGILLVELISSTHEPYPGMTNDDVISYLKQGKIHPQPENCPDNWYAIMALCWQYDQKQRPPFTELAINLGQINES